MVTLVTKLTNCCLVDLTDVTLASEDAHSKILDDVSVLMLLLREVLTTVSLDFDADVW